MDRGLTIGATLALLSTATTATAQQGIPPQPAPPQPAPYQPAPAQPAPPAPSDYTPPGASSAPRVPPDRDEVHWFLRMGLGLGPRGLSGNNALLDAVGYPGVKMWAELDGAYMLHRRIGIGLWMGMNRRSGHPEGGGVAMNAVSYFIGAEVPILIWGKRSYAFQAVPRAGFLTGQVELDNPADAPFQKTGIFGAALMFNSFTYHLGGGVAYTFAPAGAPGELDRGHDYGGFYVMLQGSFDG